ncbi:MAG: hypothetical protein K9J16_17465 [Melioribacteraceae bacterium]|nr:hypothetical protein [Melioribacteraceae bacterium]MCF8356643.1 hypothetical protein [Melioribacteraceae bacterium]MCF8396023.1 hypothetical protein [Melioribacteraceae bacterium]MCF8421052.1 hypothetical protein [Melioribacteraceae bacterium]
MKKYFMCAFLENIWIISRKERKRIEINKYNHEIFISFTGQIIYQLDNYLWINGLTPTFAKASSYAEATEDRTVGKN